MAVLVRTVQDRRRADRRHGDRRLTRTARLARGRRLSRERIALLVAHDQVHPDHTITRQVLERMLAERGLQ